MRSDDLTTIWAVIIAFAIFAYVMLDGFDLGIGILFPRFKVGHGARQAMNAVAPVWDGNETWLVMGGGGLLAAFPLAYAIILPALYPPLIAMLLGLVFRGVAFEFRWRDARHRALWDIALLRRLARSPRFAQGMTWARPAGDHGRRPRLCRRLVDWLSPFTLLTGLGWSSAIPCSAPAG